MFVTIEKAKELIAEGKILHIAADESLLKQLPKGKWIAGTIPYFITEEGGITCKDRLLVDEIPDAIEYKTMVYNKDNIADITKDAYENGITLLVMPYGSEVSVSYAKKAPYIEDLLMTPIVGWISGSDLSLKETAKVFDGFTGTSFGDKAVALHICLPDNKIAALGIVNIFEINDNSAKFEFLDDALSAQKCLVNGKQVLFADYLTENNVDIKSPLIANYNGVLMNVAIKSVSEEDKTVEFYAPVFKGNEYRFAKPVVDYVQSFEEQLKDFKDVKPVFSCNCVLNYLYGKLDKKATPPFTGPVTFGEVAYQLFSQTLVFAEIRDK